MSYDFVCDLYIQNNIENIKRQIENELHLYQKEKLAMDLHNPCYGTPLSAYLYFTYWNSSLPLPEYDRRENILYGRYYWLSLTQKKYVEYHGHDASLSQELVEILEDASLLENVNWNVIGEIDKIIDDSK